MKGIIEILGSGWAIIHINILNSFNNTQSIPSKPISLLSK
jgi:hypothetical protein